MTCDRDTLAGSDFRTLGSVTTGIAIAPITGRPCGAGMHQYRAGGGAAVYRNGVSCAVSPGCYPLQTGDEVSVPALGGRGVVTMHCDRESVASIESRKRGIDLGSLESSVLLRASVPDASWLASGPGHPL